MHSVRLLRVALTHQIEETAGVPDGSQPALELAWRLGLIDSLVNPTTQLRRAATHPERALAERLRQLSRVAFNMRDRMSADHWRALNRLSGDAVFRRHASLPLTLAWLDRAVTQLMTLSGYVLDGMTRGIGWRFLSIGRRVERLSTMSLALQVAIEEGRTHGLDWLLEFADSTVTYRSRYLVGPEWLPVLDMLLRDEANPRSVAFQAKGLVEYVARLEQSHGRFTGDHLAAAYATLRALHPRDLDPENEAVADALDRLRRAAHTVSDELSLKFFSHATSRSMLALVA